MHGVTTYGEIIPQIMRKTRANVTLHTSLTLEKNVTVKHVWQWIMMIKNVYIWGNGNILGTNDGLERQIGSPRDIRHKTSL